MTGALDCVDSKRLIEERKELFRLCGLRALATRPDMPLSERAWAEIAAAQKPLDGTLSTGLLKTADKPQM